jgi:uncharacterized protein YyaL (SSP411 family)
MPVFDVLSNAVAWLPWGAAAFSRARDEHKPVLLSMTATWCGSCREMERTTYGDPSIATLINRRFVPIRVDVDQRPDIGERYGLGGWPTTAFLTPGGALLGGGTFVPQDRMASVLGRVTDAFAARGADLDESLPDATAPAPGSALSIAGLTAAVFDAFDDEYGGFGVAPKFPLVAPLQLALALVRDEDESRSREIVEATLDAMGWGGLYDEVDGGFFRFARARDWQLPQSEKMLDVNAALLRLYLDAGSTLELARFSERAADVLRYIQTWLADSVDGGWWGAQQADAEYYATGSAEERRLRTAPSVGSVWYADSNAIMVSAALHAARTFEDEGLRDFALKSFERVLLACYKPGAGVAHSFGHHVGVRGLLADQFAMASASLDAFEATGNIVYEMMAEELAHYAVRTMWDETGGGFFDRAAEAPPAAIGLMRRRLKPFAVNCDLVPTLRRLAAASGEHEFGALADRTLEAMAPLAPAQGPLAAHYLLAVRAAAVR